MFKVAICDDTPHIANEVGELLFQYDPKLFDIYIYYSSDKLLKQMDLINFDFFILDIKMPQFNGIDIAEKIREKNLHIPIVFLANFREYMEEVFRIQTFGYVIKPIKRERLYSLLNRLRQYFGANDQKFVFSYNKKIYQLSNKEILYFEKNRRQVIVHTH